MSTTQKKPFYDQRYEIVEDLERNFPKIKAEYQNVVGKNLHVNWHETNLYNEGWNVFGLRFQRIDFQEQQLLCPQISQLLHKYDAMISTMGFSTLSPGTIIYPHYGYTDTVLRCHLGIEIPEGDCCLKVDGVIRTWKEGKAFVFDDTLEHEAWNKTDFTRTVMLIDLEKSDLMLNH